MKKFRTISFSLIGGIFLVSSAHAESTGSLINSSDLISKPFIDAEVLSKLPEKTALKVVRNQGGWSLVKTTDGIEGWVRMLNVRLGKPEEPAKLSDTKQTFAQIGGIFRTGTTKAVATTGVKGLSKEAIMKASPNPAAVRRMDTHKVSDAEIQQFASSRQLTAQDIPE